MWNKEPFGPPAYGMFARNVKGLTLHNVRFEFEQPDLRPAVVFDNVRDASVGNLAVEANREAESMLRFTRCRDVLLSAARVLTPAPAFLRLEGSDNADITIDGGDLRKAAKVVETAAGGSEDAVRVRE